MQNQLNTIYYKSDFMIFSKKSKSLINYEHITQIKMSLKKFLVLIDQK
jgi:hypothetical protein